MSGVQKKVCSELHLWKVSMINIETSSWRGIIAEEFIFHNVAVVTYAIANLIKEEYKKFLPL
jgi:hypothetical protein